MLSSSGRTRAYASSGQLETGDEAAQFPDRHAMQVVDGAAADRDRERLGPQARAVALRAGLVAAEARDEDAHVHLVALALAPAEEALDAGEALVAAKDPGLLLGREIGEGHVGRDPARGRLAQQLAVPGARRGHAEWDDGVIAQIAPRIGHDLGAVDRDDAPEALALRAGAQRAVPREVRRDELGHARPAGAAGESAVEHARGR